MFQRWKLFRLPRLFRDCVFLWSSGRIGKAVKLTKTEVKHSGKDKDKGKKKKSAHSKDWSEDDKKNNSDGGKNASEIKRNEKGQLVFKGEVKNVLRYRFMNSFTNLSFFLLLQATQSSHLTWLLKRFYRQAVLGVPILGPSTPVSQVCLTVISCWV